MSFSPHEVYSRYLVGPEGYPLWTPQLKAELPEDYQREGLKIGDVGHVLPRNGSFDVLFNITLPRNQQPDPKLVREGFRPVILDQADFATQHDALPAHGVIPRASVELTSKYVDARRDQTPSRADYEFSLSMEDGAVLILPEGAQSRDLQNERRFLDEAIRHAVDWYECATEEGGRLISNDSLYLITGFHKAHSWSLGAAGRSLSSLHERRSAKFRVGQIHEGSATAEAYSWEATHGFEGRFGPMHPYQLPNHIFSGGIRGGVPNQTVFIRGFRITVNKILFLKTVSVKAGQNTHFKFTGFGSSMFNLLSGGTAESGSSSGVETSTDNTTDQDSLVNRGRPNMNTRVTIDRMPNVSRTVHPGDLVNQCMLKKEPRAMVAITHDSLWIEMLRMGVLELAAFSHENRLQDVLSKNYRMMLKDGKCRLPSKRYLGLDSHGRALETPPHEHSSAPSLSCTTSMDTSHASRTVKSETLQAHADTPEQTLLDPDQLPLDLTARIIRTSDEYSAGGSFGDVYKCVCMSDGGQRDVAVKVFRFPLQPEEGNNRVYKMVRRELGIWKRLDHKSIVPFLGIAYGFGMSGCPSLVSVWMPNGSLLRFLETYGDYLEVAYRLQLLLDVANGLSYLHSFPIIHGDLNPNNVLLDADYTARLTDFGYSSVQGEIPEDLHYLQRSTGQPGALRWIAPEQLDLDSSSIHTTQSEIYSFGNMTLTVLSGQLPWAEIQGDAAVVHQLAKGLKPRRPTLRPIEDWHWEFVEQCWSPTESRPSADGVVFSIQHFLLRYPPSRPLRDVLVLPTGIRSVSGIHVPHDLHEDLLVTPDLTDKIHKADEECIFPGNFSDVYKYLYDSDHGTKEVALKVFRIKFTVGKEWNQSQVGKRVHHTLDTWRTLNHPNIVQFFGIAYGFGRQGNASFVSLWMPNGPLRVFLDRYNDRLMIAHRLQLLLDAANGLQYLHSIPIIHGDISPNNVLLDDNYNARLTDFDYASFISNRDIYLAASTLRGGALRWTAPELIGEGKPQHTTKNDIYPFGNLAYLVLSGKYPWSEIRQDAVVLLRLAEGRKASRPISAPVEDQHWGLIERCWSSVQDRPPAEAVVNDIQKFLGAYSPPQCLRDLLAVPTTSKTIPRSDLARSVTIASQPH